MPAERLRADATKLQAAGCFAVVLEVVPGDLAADITCTGCVSSDEIAALDWTKLQNYPATCGAGNAIQAVGDTLTCVGVGGDLEAVLDAGNTGGPSNDLLIDDGYIAACDGEACTRLFGESPADRRCSVVRAKAAASGWSAGLGRGAP